jgi:biopolymer transport protein ExbD
MPLVRLTDTEDPAPNLAPMIDVVLVLTIFFMCATKFAGDDRAFDLDLPQARAATADAGSRPEVVEVRASGTLRLGGDELSTEELPARLATLRADRPDLAVMIRGEQAVTHGRMTEVYDACREAGVNRVAIAVRPRGEAVRE